MAGPSAERPSVRRPSNLVGETDNENLVKIIIDLPNHWTTGGESMWACPLADDLYEIRNIPFYAYGLNFLDVVRAIEPSADRKPEITALVRSSGHRTLRVIFMDKGTEKEHFELLRQLNPMKAYFEGSTPGHFAIDVEPEADYDAVRDQLDSWESAGILDYETCEARSPDSFDADPEEYE